MIKWFINWLFPASPSRALSTDPEPVRKYEPKRIKAPSALDVPTPRRRPVRATPAPQRRETEASSARQPRRSYVEDSSSGLADVMIGVAVVQTPLGNAVVMREDYTCGCGIPVHPKHRQKGWHIPDCEFFTQEENFDVEAENLRWIID